MEPRTRRRKTPAFTLIELLVVVAIIALLISILLPSLSAARETAKQTVCGTQLKALGTAKEMCYTDNRDYGPTWDDGVVVQSQPEGERMMYTWVDVYADLNYVGDDEIGLCPTDLRPSEVTELIATESGWGYVWVDPPGIGGRKKAGVRTSYALNNVFHFNFKEDRDLKNPSRQVYAMDGYWTWFAALNASYVWDVTKFGGTSDPVNYLWQGNNFLGWRHRDLQANALFADSSVRPIKPREPSTRAQNENPGAEDTALAYTWRPGERPNRFYQQDPYEGEILSMRGDKPAHLQARDHEIPFKIYVPGGEANDNFHPTSYPEQLSAAVRTLRRLWKKVPSDPRGRIDSDLAP